MWVHRIEAIIAFLRGGGKRIWGNSQRKVVRDGDERRDKGKGKWRAFSRAHDWNLGYLGSGCEVRKWVGPQPEKPQPSL